MAAKAKKEKLEITAEIILFLRKYFRLNQEDFWSKVLVTQSGGSRYENGRRIPPLVQAMVIAVYLVPGEMRVLKNILISITTKPLLYGTVELYAEAGTDLHKKEDIAEYKRLVKKFTPK